MTTKLEKGKVYDVHHSRKGRFRVRMDDVGEEFSHGTIVHGVAKAMMHYNERHKGERIDFRNSFIISAKEVSA